jgi:hypothetical protein
MNGGAQTKSDDRNAQVKHAFFSVEGEIHDVSHMASIAANLIADVGVGAETGCTIELRISQEEFEQIQFAVSQTSTLAKELVTAFRKEFEKAPPA